MLYQLSYRPKKNVLLPATTLQRVVHLPKHSARTAPNWLVFAAHTFADSPILTTLKKMEPYVRDFADPFEGLQLQLKELEAFARVVPQVIDARRKEVWDKVMAQPGDPDIDPLDAFAKAIDEGPGGGFSNFERTVYIAALALGFEAFIDYLALNLARRERGDAFVSRTTARDQLEEEITRLDFPKLIARFKSMSVYPRKLSGWDAVEEIQFTRNAVVHNHGRYNRKYFNVVKQPRYPTSDDKSGWDPAQNMSEIEKQDWLVDREDIPLSFAYVSSSLEALSNFAELIEMA